MLINDIYKIFSHPALTLKNSNGQFIDKCYETMHYLIKEANESMPDGHDKEQAFYYLNLALFHIAKGAFNVGK